MRKAVAACAAVLALAGAGGAAAITYGQPDGSDHAYVGALVATNPQGQRQVVCSGFLAAPTVFVTAAHCTSFLQQQGIAQVWVTFDQTFGASSPLVPGTMVTDPAFGGGGADPADVAVVLLAHPQAIAPAALPTLGLLDRLSAQNGLRGQTFVAVGYGVQEPVNGPGGKTLPGGGSRWQAVSAFSALNPYWLRLSQNDTLGWGGTCTGDSGGPDLLGSSDVAVALTSTGDRYCRATSVDYRLDTSAARAFLAQFVPLP